MAGLPAAMFTIARAQHGLLTRDQIEGVGVSPSRRRRLTRTGLVREVQPGVYRVESSRPTFEQACLAVCLVDEGAIISGPTAGLLWKLRKMPRGPIHAMVHRRNRYLEGVTVHRTEDLAPSDVVVRNDGIRLLSLPRLIADLARHLDDEDLESVIEQALDRRGCTVYGLLQLAGRLAVPGREGTVRLGRVLRSRPAWTKPNQSDLEVIVLRGLRGRGIDLEPQLRVELATSEVVHLDGGDRSLRFGIEVDHVTWHGGRATVQYDKLRDRRLQREGWIVPRVTDDDVRLRLDETLDDVEAIYRRIAQRAAS